jgi:hypothetical protein
MDYQSRETNETKREYASYQRVKGRYLAEKKNLGVKNIQTGGDFLNTVVPDDFPNEWKISGPASFSIYKKNNKRIYLFEDVHYSWENTCTPLGESVATTYAEYINKCTASKNCITTQQFIEKCTERAKKRGERVGLYLEVEQKKECCIIKQREWATKLIADIHSTKPSAYLPGSLDEVLLARDLTTDPSIVFTHVDVRYNSKACMCWIRMELEPSFIKEPIAEMTNNQIEELQKFYTEGVMKHVKIFNEYIKQILEDAKELNYNERYVYIYKKFLLQEFPKIAKLASQIDKELYYRTIVDADEMLAYRLKLYNDCFIKPYTEIYDFQYAYDYFQTLYERLMDNTERIGEQDAVSLRTLAMVIQDMIYSIGAFCMDTYVLIKLIEDPEKNRIIYVGNMHAQTYRKMLINLGYEELLLTSKYDLYNGATINRCLDNINLSFKKVVNFDV